MKGPRWQQTVTKPTSPCERARSSAPKKHCGNQTQGQVILSGQCAAMPEASWETAVIWLRQQADQQEFVRACYFDDPLVEAARRFADSDEWTALRKLLPSIPAAALDLGAGRGISSYAMARDGWDVTALEPDPSPLVGAEAIRRLAKESGLSISVVEDYCERMPFSDNEFDLVHGRQVLHHAKNLDLLCREVFRVLKPHGRFVATREHVVGSPADLQTFLDSHPLHWLYGGESAYSLREYRFGHSWKRPSAAQNSGTIRQPHQLCSNDA